MTESTTLRWDVDFLSGDDINRVTFFLGDAIGREFSPMNRGTGVVYKFNLTSKSPLSSTMTISTPADLSGATVSCSSGVQSSADVAILALNGKLNKTNVDPSSSRIGAVQDIDRIQHNGMLGKQNRSLVFLYVVTCICTYL